MHAWGQRCPMDDAPRDHWVKPRTLPVTQEPHNIMLHKTKQNIRKRPLTNCNEASYTQTTITIYTNRNELQPAATKYVSVSRK